MVGVCVTVGRGGGGKEGGGMFGHSVGRGTGDDDDELMLNVLRCHLTY